MSLATRRTEHHGAGKKRGALQRRWESRFGTGLFLPPEQPRLGRRYPGWVWNGRLRRVFSLHLGSNSPKSCSQPGRHSGRAHPHPGYL